jgi:ATP-dependent Lon protease
MDEVLERALTRMPEPIEWDEAAARSGAASATEAAVEEEIPGLTAH